MGRIVSSKCIEYSVYTMSNTCRAVVRLTPAIQIQVDAVDSMWRVAGMQR